MSIEIANESGSTSTRPSWRRWPGILDEMRIHPLAELSVLLVDGGP